jgi:hypothetical protein
MAGTDPTQNPVAASLSRLVAEFDRITKPLEQIKEGDDAEMANIILCLASDGLLWYNELIGAASRSANAPLAAFCARNILEVAVWTSYCLASRDNAKRFTEDAKRDVNGILGICKRVGEVAKAHPDKGILDPATWQLLADVEARGELDDKYLPVHEAAKSLGTDEGIAFSAFNKLFSKFAHPTALTVSNVFIGEAGKQWSELFIKIGSGLFTFMMTEIAQHRFSSPSETSVL